MNLKSPRASKLESCSYSFHFISRCYQDGQIELPWDSLRHCFNAAHCYRQSDKGLLACIIEHLRRLIPQNFEASDMNQEAALLSRVAETYLEDYKTIYLPFSYQFDRISLRRPQKKNWSRSRNILEGSGEGSGCTSSTNV